MAKPGLQMHCLYSPIISKHLNLSSCFAAASDASLFIFLAPFPVGSATSCADVIFFNYRAPFAVLFIAHHGFLEEEAEDSNGKRLCLPLSASSRLCSSSVVQPKVKYTPRRGSKAADTGRKGEATGGKTGNKGKRKGKNGGGGPKKGVKGGAKKPAAKDILRTTVTRKQNSERTISPFLGGGSVVQSSSAAASRGAPVRDDRPVRDETSSVLGRQRKEKSNAERRNFSNSSSSTDQSLVNRTQAQSSSNSSSDWPLEQTLQRETAQSSKKISLKGMVSATGERRQPKGKRNVSRWSEGADGEQDSSHLPTEVDTVRGREGGKRRRREEVGVNSDSEKGGERGKKRRRRRGEEVGANSSDSGEEGGERRGRSRVREVRVSATSLDKWKPVSLVARKLLSDAMVSALG